jgi:rubredoxin
MERKHICPDCRVEMQEGFVPDHYSQTIRSQWHPGPGTDKTFFGNLKMDSEKMIPIVAYRCPECGFLKHLAIADRADG